MVETVNKLITWKVWIIEYGVGEPKWYHKQWFHYSKGRILVKVDPYKSTNFGKVFSSVLYVGPEGERKVMATFEGRDDCTIVIKSRLGVSGIDLFNWYLNRLNLINATNVTWLGNVGGPYKDRFAPSLKRREQDVIEEVSVVKE